MFLCAGVASVRYKIYDSQIATLKEIKPSPSSEFLNFKHRCEGSNSIDAVGRL